MISYPDHPSLHDHPDAPLSCTICTRPLAGCSAGLFCVGCGRKHVERKRWGYSDLRPSVYYVLDPAKRG